MLNLLVNCMQNHNSMPNWTMKIVDFHKPQLSYKRLLRRKNQWEKRETVYVWKEFSSLFHCPSFDLLLDLWNVTPLHKTLSARLKLSSISFSTNNKKKEMTKEKILKVILRRRKENCREDEIQDNILKSGMNYNLNSSF